MKKVLILFVCCFAVFCLLLYYAPAVLLVLFLIAGICCMLELSAARKIYEFEEEKETEEKDE